MDKSLVTRSRFLSLVLRHEPGRIGLVLDDEGWAGIEELLAKATAHGVQIDRPTLDRIVAENDKQRFAVSADGRRIRASQGHSVAIDLGLVPVVPPQLLFHGTAARNLASIRQSGLNPGVRQHVHLSADAVTAERVGARHGMPVVLRVDSAGMHAQGHAFFCSDNGVWLTAAVPVRFISVPD